MATLKDELTADAERLGYADLVAAGSHNRIADALNEPRYAGYGPVAISDMLIWAAT